MKHRKRMLLRTLVKRDISARYRGSFLGMLWPLLTPLFMLAVYTFVFGTIYKTRWTIPGREVADHSVGEFAVILFAGLIVFQIFAEVVQKAPPLIVGNSNYVKKVVFPIEILPLVTVGTALFHAVVSYVVLLVFVHFVFGSIPSTAILLPVVLAPLVILVVGLSWFFSAIGVFVRDIGEILGPVVTALMFLSPIFFPSSSMPVWVQPYYYLNPMALPVEMSRDVLIFGKIPDLATYGVYLMIALFVCELGFLFFQKVRKGFADVL
jgi:lipopolysaccharide transport system permease protein